MRISVLGGIAAVVVVAVGVVVVGLVRNKARVQGSHFASVSSPAPGRRQRNLMGLRMMMLS